MTQADAWSAAARELVEVMDENWTTIAMALRLIPRQDALAAFAKIDAAFRVANAAK